MGVDVNLYAEGEVTDGELAAAEAYMQARVGNLAWQEGAALLRRLSYPSPRVEVYTGQRYWAPGFERGYWPFIAAAILALRVALPNCTVFYGSDTSDDGEPATDELLTEYGLHWLGPDGDAYHERP